MDLVMPELDGVEATRRVRESSPPVRVIVLTSFSNDEKIFPALEAGALSYLLEGVEPDELVGAIRAASRGESVVHPRIAARLVRVWPTGQTVAQVETRLGDVLLLSEIGLSG